jgi:hypothetical protein
MLMVSVYRSILTSIALPRVSDIEFLWLDDDAAQSGFKQGEIFRGKPPGESANRVRITFTKGTPNAALDGEHKGKLLVTNYAWDSNSFRQSFSLSIQVTYVRTARFASIFC